MSFPRECTALIERDQPVCGYRHRFCSALAWGEVGPGKFTRCPEHGGPEAPLHCRACGRVLAFLFDETTGERVFDEGEEPVCEVCSAQHFHLVQRGEFIAELERLAAAGKA